MTSRLMLTLVVCAACSGGKHERSSEEDYIATQLGELRTAIAARDQAKIVTGCMVVTVGTSRLPADMVAEIDQQCHVDAPRILLEEAIRDATKNQGTGLGRDLTCYQLFAEDAFKLLAKHAPTPAVDALVSQYEHLCPDKVATFRARAHNR